MDVTSSRSSTTTTTTVSSDDLQLRLESENMTMQNTIMKMQNMFVTMEERMEEKIENLLQQQKIRDQAQDRKDQVRDLKDKVKDAQLAKINQKLQVKDAQVVTINQQLAQIQGRKMQRALEAGATITKIVVKVGLTSMVFHIGKLVSLETAKAVSKTAAKYIPFVGLGVGVVACVYRLSKEDVTMAEWVKAIAELGSGVASVFLGVGTLIAFLMDISIAGHDMYEIYHSPDAGSKPPVCIEQEHELTLKDAYEALHIQSDKPTQREVDKAYRAQTQKIHPDLNASSEKGNLLSHHHNMTVLMNECRDLIYKENSWV